MTTRPLSLLPCCTLLLAALAAGSLLSVAPARAEATGNIETNLLQHQKKINRLEQGIEEHTGRLLQTKKQAATLTAELEEIDRRMHNEQRQLKELSQLLANREEALAAQENEVALVTEEKAKRQGPVKKRLAAFYRMGNIGVINLLFSATTLPDLIKFKEYFHQILQHDQQTFEGYRQTINRLATARTALEQEKERLVALIAGITAQQQQLAATRSERSALLARVNTEKKLYQRAVQEMKEAALDLTATINKLKNEASRAEEAPKTQAPQSDKKRRPPAGKGFASLKGGLDPPVSGTVTTLFGRNTSEKFGITTYENGIDIKTEPGAEVQAIHDGTVAFAGILRGYGNLVIIDHGGQYYSLVSRIARLLTDEGVKVKRGQPVGTMGEGGGLLSEGLHFEIRNGTKPEDPLLWVDKNKLKIQPSRQKP